MTKLLLSLLAAAALARGEFNEQHWRLRKPLQVDASAQVSVVQVDSQIFQSSARLDDVRIVRDGSEIPYLLQTLYGERQEREFQPTISDQSATNEGVEVTLDAGGHPRHNRVRLATGRTNFKQTVRLETSDDGEHWAVARRDGLIFDASKGDEHAAMLTVEYPVSTRRFIRITVLGWSNPADLISAWLAYHTETNGVRDMLAAPAPKVEEDARTQTSIWTADIGFDGLPHDGVQIEAAPGLFYRGVEIESSRDTKSWLYIGQRTISRTADHESLALAFPEQWDRYLRLRIHNGDDSPLDARRLSFSAYRRVIKFPSNAGGRYWIYYGNPEAKRPSYDFAQVISTGMKADDAASGAEERNPGYVPHEAPPKPWTDRYPWVLYTALSAAVLGMGYAAVKLLLSVRATASSK